MSNCNTHCNTDLGKFQDIFIFPLHHRQNPSGFVKFPLAQKPNQTTSVKFPKNFVKFLPFQHNFLPTFVKFLSVFVKHHFSQFLTKIFLRARVFSPPGTPNKRFFITRITKHKLSLHLHQPAKLLASHAPWYKNFSSVRLTVHNIFPHQQQRVQTSTPPGRQNKKVMPTKISEQNLLIFSRKQIKKFYYFDTSAGYIFLNKNPALRSSDPSTSAHVTLKFNGP